MQDQIPADWRIALFEAISAPSFPDMGSFVTAERRRLSAMRSMLRQDVLRNSQPRMVA